MTTLTLKGWGPFPLLGRSDGVAVLGTSSTATKDHTGHMKGGIVSPAISAHCLETEKK